MREKKFTKTNLLIPVIVIGCFVGFFTWKANQTNTSIITAHPADLIVVDKASVHEFTVPEASTSLVEPRLLKKPVFSKYVQNALQKEGLYKEKYRSIQDSVGQETYYDSIVLPGNRLIALGYETDYQEPLSSFANVFISIIASDGKELTRTYVTQGYTGTKEQIGSYHLDHSLALLPNGNVSALYRNYEQMISLLEIIQNASVVYFELLGYKDGDVGPQQMTHFITNDSLQVSSTSQLITSVTNATQKNKKTYLDAPKGSSG